MIENECMCESVCVFVYVCVYVYMHLRIKINTLISDVILRYTPKRLQLSFIV